MNTGALRTRWTRYDVNAAPTEPKPINLNCWRATIYFSDPATTKLFWDGIALEGIMPLFPVGQIFTVVIGGAMYDERPVYLNETHYFAASGPGSILVVEEFYDPAVKPNN